MSTKLEADSEAAIELESELQSIALDIQRLSERAYRVGYDIVISRGAYDEFVISPRLSDADFDLFPSE